jgi:hypothetical protein
MKEMEFKLFKGKDGKFKIKHNKVVIVDKIPEEDLADYILSETSASFFRAAEKVEEYLWLARANCQQLSMDLFNTSKLKHQIYGGEKAGGMSVSISDVDPIDDVPGMRTIHGIPGSELMEVINPEKVGIKTLNAEGISSGSEKGKSEIEHVQVQRE